MIDDEFFERIGKEAAPFADSLGCGFAVSDESGTVRFLNRRMAEMVGYEPHELVGRPPLLPEDSDRVLSARRTAHRNTGEVIPYRLALPHKQGHTVPALVVPRLLRDAEGEIQAALALVIDLSPVESVANEESGRLHDAMRRIASELAALGVVPVDREADAATVSPYLVRKLSRRELEILRLLVAGHRVPFIARRLEISPHTVRSHLTSIFRKLHVRSQAELIELVRGPE